GGTHRSLTQLYARWGIHTIFVSPQNPTELENALADPTVQLVWLETPTNPLLTVVDIHAWAELAHAHDALLVVDNTFASPPWKTPLYLVPDAVFPPTPNKLEDNSEFPAGEPCFGDAIWEDQPLAELLAFQQFAGGAVAGPQDAFLTSRGLKTLGVRMKQHCENAGIIAEWLQSRAVVKNVYYPGLESHPTHHLAREQMSGF